jgi:FtsZ-binding cell division protein ZapB
MSEYYTIKRKDYDELIRTIYKDAIPKIQELKQEIKSLKEQNKILESERYFLRELVKQKAQQGSGIAQRTPRFEEIADREFNL